MRALSEVGIWFIIDDDSWAVAGAVNGRELRRLRWKGSDRHLVEVFLESNRALLKLLLLLLLMLLILLLSDWSTLEHNVRHRRLPPRTIRRKVVR